MNSGLASDTTLTNAGERMIEGNMWGYWAHLSIYHFAVEYARGRRVLDAGSGSGYGSAYLSRHGASVLGLDFGQVAIEHSRARYGGDAVTFEVADLNLPLQLGDAVFDLVFSSNVFEHVRNVDGLASECARVVKPDGAVIVAVPPLTSSAAMRADMENHFHIHHIPPVAWYSKLSRFFTEIECYRHIGRGAYSTPERERLEMSLPPTEVSIRETDFDFPRCSPEELNVEPSYTAVFICRGRRTLPKPETLVERTPSAWCESEAAARLISDERAAREAVESQLKQTRQALDALEQRAQEAEGSAAEMSRMLASTEDDRDRLRLQLVAIEGSTTWRGMAPVRTIVELLRVQLRGGRTRS